MKTITKTWKENKYKVLTIVFSSLFILFITYDLIIPSESVEDKDNKLICSRIKGTPAWVDNNGNIIRYGVITINQSSQEFSDDLTNMLMENKIKFVYNTNCAYCQLQISIFGEKNFNKLKEEGLTLDCAK